jgi:hypothetical protein
MMVCNECKQNLPENEFWEKRINREHQYIRHDKCKECCLKNFDINNLNTLSYLCEELNFPFLRFQLEYIPHGDLPLTSRQFANRYFAKMKLMSFRWMLFEDSDELNQLWERKKEKYV